MLNAVKKIFYLLPKGDPWKFAALFGLMLVAAILEVAGIGMIPAFVAIIAQPDQVLEYPLIEPVLAYLEITNAQDLLIWGSAALVGIFVVKSCYIIAFNYIEANFIYNRRYYISKKLMSAYMRAPYTFHLQRNTAELLRNIINEVNILVNSVMASFLKLSREFVMAASIIIFLFVAEPLITIVVLALSGLGAGSFLFLTQKKMKQYGEEEQGYRSGMIKAVNQGLGGIKDARVLNREAEFINTFNFEAYHSSKLLAFSRFIKQIPRPLIETTAVVGMMMVAGLMVWQGRAMATIIPILTLFAMATVRLMPAVQQITSLYTNLQYNIIAVDPIYDDIKALEDHELKFVSERAEQQKVALAREINVENVHYHYPNSSEQALNGVSLTIPKNSAVGFVGPSGAGKTTMVDVLLGLLEPQKGKIKVDGIDIRDNLSGWQRNIGYIPQSIYLSDDSLRSNIAFGVPEDDIEDEKVWQAIELAQLQTLLSKMPAELDTIIGERGTLLSGGQQQRVGIARALYHNPQVLVMDEATSALDNITEQYIMKAIEALKGEKTIIMIAHRLSTVKNCDQLYLMKEGEIVEYGTYSNLLQKSEDFQKMNLHS